MSLLDHENTVQGHKLGTSLSVAGAATKSVEVETEKRKSTELNGEVEVKELTLTDLEDPLSLHTFDKFPGLGSSSNNQVREETVGENTTSTVHCSESSPTSGIKFERTTSNSAVTKKVKDNVNERITCEYCGKGFTKKWALKVHHRTHTGLRPYICDVCSKGFLQSGDLNRHLRVHTGEKPFTCEYCLRGFSRLLTRRQHQLICKGRPRDKESTGRTLLACTICKATFLKASDLQKHRASHRLATASSRPSFIQMKIPSRALRDKCCNDDRVTMVKEREKHDVEKSETLNVSHNSTDYVSDKANISVNGNVKQNDTLLSQQEISDQEVQDRTDMTPVSDEHYFYDEENSLHKAERKGAFGLSDGLPHKDLRGKLNHTPHQQHPTMVSTEDNFGKNISTFAGSSTGLLTQLRDERPICYTKESVVYKGSYRDDGNVKCTVCSKQFLTSSALERHMLLHEIIKRRRERSFLVNGLQSCDETQQELTERAASDRDCLYLPTMVSKDINISTTPTRSAKSIKPGMDLKTLLLSDSTTSGFGYLGEETSSEGQESGCDAARSKLGFSHSRTAPLSRDDTVSSVHSARSNFHCHLNDVIRSDGIYNEKQTLFDNELVLKVRLANLSDKDFIEVDIDTNELTFENLVRTCCHELSLNRNQIVKIRKLPDTTLRRDKDVMRLHPYQELEVVFE